MDKAQELRRGTSGVYVAKGRIKQSQTKFFSGLNNGGEGDILSSDKSKKEKLRRLSFIGIVNQNLEACDMDANLLDRDDETVGSSRKYKLPKKFLNDSDCVDQASVPRKLRSAIKKRNGDSLSPSPHDPKKVKATLRGIESLKSEDVKKSKLSMKRRSLEEKPSELVDSEEITKDEEEVAETLYALAGMFPTNDEIESSKMESESLVNLETKGSPTFECEDSPAKGKLQPNIPAMFPANLESTLGKGTMPNLSLNETCNEEQSDIGKTDGSVCEIELHNSDGPLDVRHLTLHKQPYTSSSMRKPVITPTQELIPIGSLLEEQKVNKEKKKNSSVLWPGLSPSALLQDAGGSYQPKSYVNDPYRLHPTFIGHQFGTEENCSAGKMSRSKADGKPSKKCAAHIYISRLISTLQENKNRLPFQLDQSIPGEASKQGSTMAAKRVRTGLNEVASENNIAGKYTMDTRNGISHLKQLNHDPLQKESFDFLSLSTKVGGSEASNDYNKSGIALEPMTQFHVPRLYSVGQQPQPPSALLQAHHSPGDFPDLPSLSSAIPQQVKLPQHMGRQTNSGSHPSSTASAKGQQWLWASELAARYRSVETTTSNSEVQCWLNGRNFYFSSYAPSTIFGNSFL